MTIRFKMPIAYAIGSFSNGTGNIKPGTRLRFYNPGGTTPRTVYSDSELSIAIPQPIAADSAGRFPDIYLQSGLYKVRWETSAGAEIDTWDDVDPGLATGGSGGILGVQDGGTGAGTAGGALSNLGAAPQSALDTEISDRQALDARVVTLENSSAFITPGGRLTLSSGVPVLTSDVTAASTVYYAIYIHNRVPLWNGTKWTLTEFAETSQTLADTTKSPAAAVNDSLYDMFVWSDSGTVRCTRGPAWDSSTSRGTGAGKTELVRVDGFWMNAQNITNGPSAQRGLYVGTIATNGSAQLQMMFLPSAANGGTNNRLDVWNMYNRVPVTSVCRDSGSAWNYTTNTLREANNSTSNRITFVSGLAEESLTAAYTTTVTNGSNVAITATIGLDSVTDAAPGAVSAGLVALSGGQTARSSLMCMTSLGRHYIQALEASAASGTSSWSAVNLSMQIRM